MVILQLLSILILLGAAVLSIRLFLFTQKRWLWIGLWLALLLLIIGRVILLLVSPGATPLAVLNDALASLIILGGCLLFRTYLQRIRNHQKSVQAEQQSYQTMISHIPDMVARFDRQYRHLFANAAVERELGLPAGQVIGKRLGELGLPQELVVWSEAIIREVFETGQPKTFEVVLPTPDGDRYYLSYGVPEFNPSGQVVSALFIHRNVTERKRTEAALALSEQKFRSMVLSAPMGMHFYHLEADGRLVLVDANPAADRILKIQHAAQFQKTIEEVFPGLAGTEVPQIYRRLAAEGGIWQVENIDYAEGVIRGAFQVIAFQTSPGNMVATFFDITERKQAERALVQANASLQASEEKYRLLIQNIQAAVIVHGPDTSILLSNRLAQEMFGLSADEMIGRKADDSFWRLLTEDGNPLPLSDYPVLRVLSTGEPIQSQVYGIRKGQHRSITWVLVNAEAARGSDGAISQVVVIFSDITEQKHNEERLKAGFALNHMALKMSEAEIVEYGLEAAVRQSSSDAGYLHFIHADGNQLDGVFWSRQVREDCQSLPESHHPLNQAGVWADCVREGRPIIHNDFAAVQGRQGYPVTHIPIDRHCVVPVFDQGKPVMILGVGNKDQPYDDADVRLLAAFGTDLWTIIRQKRADQVIQQQVTHLSLLRRLDRVIIENEAVVTSLDALLDPLANYLHADAIGILLLDASGQVLRHGAGRGFQSPVHLQPLQATLGMPGMTLARQQPVNLPDLRKHPDLLSLPFYQAEGFLAAYSVPLSTPSRQQGVLQVFYRHPQVIDDSEIKFLETAAGQIAIAIEKNTLWEKLQLTLQEVVQAYETTLEGWVYALDLRDRETEHHTRRVTEQTVQIARAMGLPEQDLVNIRRGALLHDIGKMAVPDEILHKPGPLTEEERAIIQRHPRHAYEMLSHIPYLRQALDIPFAHHEKWDGTGYPQGLKGDEIPLAARIFAVVDVWDALTTKRIYREALSAPEAEQYLIEQSGKQFDPVVVSHFLSRLHGENGG